MLSALKLIALGDKEKVGGVVDYMRSLFTTNSTRKAQTGEVDEEHIRLESDHGDHPSQASKKHVHDEGLFDAAMSSLLGSMLKTRAGASLYSV